jgi:hypothetical protein
LPTTLPTTVPSSTDTGNPTGAPPETLTVQHGNNTLRMTGPNGQGTMQLTTQDGTGQPKSYDIAFGHGATATSTAMPAPTSTPVSASNVQHITPGADGTAVIHDGNTTITAREQPGGEVKVTVDDGSGQPTTYTLDHAGTQPTTATGTAAPMATSTAAPAQPVTDPATLAAHSAAPVAAPAAPADAAVAPAAAPATLVSDTSQQAGFIDPSAMPQPTQTTQPATTGDPGALVGGTDNSGFAQGFSDPSSSFGNAVGGAVGGSHAAAAFFGPQHDTHDMFGGAPVPGHAGVAGTDVTPMGQPGGAGLAAAPDSAPDQGQQGQPSQLGGMPMMGGMGGGGGQGGGDQQRGPNPWRTQGQLFDDADDVVGRFSGTLDDGR